MNEIIPPELASKPFSEWQLNLITVFIVTQILGRAYAAIRNEGGLKSILCAIWFGTNTPKKGDDNE